MTVEIVPNDDWRATVGGTEAEALRRTDARRIIVQTLAEHGPVVSKNGRATAQLMELAAARGHTGETLAGFNGLLRKGPMRLAIDRDTRGRRTFRFELARIPEHWADWLNGLGTETESEPEPAPEPVPEAVEPEPEPATLVAVEDEPDYEDWKPDLAELRLDVAGSVATALLTKVVEIITTPDHDKQAVMERDRARAELGEARERLARALEHSQRVSRDHRATQDELVAVKNERDGLRQRLRMAEANLARVTAPNADTQRVVNELVQVELAKVMQAPPRPHHG